SSPGSSPGPSPSTSNDPRSTPRRGSVCRAGGRWRRWSASAWAGCQPSSRHSGFPGLWRWSSPYSGPERRHGTPAGSTRTPTASRRPLDVLLLSDIHGEFEALARLAASGELLVILGDIVNLIDYRTGEGIISAGRGSGLGRRVPGRRGDRDYQRMRQLWNERMAARGSESVRAEMRSGVSRQYAECRAALEGAEGFVTYGNVDR